MSGLVTALALTALQAGTSPAGPDSVELHRAMIAAQRRFEFARRRLLPISTAGTGRCDERVGRFCYWYDPEEPPPPEEPMSIREERERFLSRLADAAEQLPGDEWILAQRVRYLVEHGANDSAATIARGCDTWWCEALEGFALHVKGDVAGSEQSFTAMLSQMPSEERCRWNDLELVLEPDDREPYQRLDCGQRDSANAVLFWRATPLFARGGNDTRTEWYARQVLVRALDRAITHHGMRLGGDLREILIRYGWATAYGRRPNPYGGFEEVDVVGHEPKPAYPFLGFDSRGRWPPEPDRPRARFAPVFASLIAPLDDVQLARFRRDDSVIVVAGFRAGRDTLFRAPQLEITLAFSAGPDVPVRVRRQRIADREGGLMVAGSSLTGSVSLELADSVHRSWAVHRVHYLEAPEGMSDLLLTRTRDELPGSLSEAAEAAWPGSRLEQGSTVGLYWESYGHAAGDSLLQVGLTVEPVRPGFLGRVGQSLGLRRRVPPLRLAWSQRQEGTTAVTGHAVEVDLSRLAPGSYLLLVEMGGDRRAGRSIEIVRASRVVSREPAGAERR
ncbi:MAG TPA: hypothetical protein VGA78_10760 [Gemmatimonadales bacterium]